MLVLRISIALGFISELVTDSRMPLPGWLDWKVRPSHLLSEKGVVLVEIDR